MFNVRADESEASKKDLAHLQGEWAMVSGERGGQALPADTIKTSRRTAKYDEVTVIMAGQIFMKAKFTLDPSKTPKAIDYAVTGGHYAGKTELGIYEFDGEQVKFCFAVPSEPRPTEFSTKPEDGRTVSVWQRAGKK